MDCHCIRSAIAATAFAVGAVFAAPAAYAAPFDGPWSVTVVTRSGTCEGSYRYGVLVSGGRVSYLGGGGVAVSGRVTSSGAVSVSVAASGNRAHGTGRLSARGTGGGTWRGSGPSGACAGVWSASRG
jgi:hypothetical protein